MSTAIAFILWLLAAVLLVLLLVISTPLRIELRAIAEETFRFSIAVRPFGRFGPRVSLSDRPSGSRKSANATSRKAVNRALRRPAAPRMFRAVARLLTDILYRVRIRGVSLDMRFGVGDPGETGQIFGLMAPLIYGLSGVPRANIAIEPVFDRIILNGRATVDVSLVPALLLPPFARFFWAVFGPVK